MAAMGHLRARKKHHDNGAGTVDTVVVPKVLSRVYRAQVPVFIDTVAWVRLENGRILPVDQLLFDDLMAAGELRL
jgi:hypothetical protein